MLAHTPPTWLPDALKAVRAREARVAVLGCGYVGLTLALAAARSGFKVLGVEPDEERAKALSEGVNPVPDVEVPEGELDRLRESGHLTFDTNDRLHAEVIALCVPTPLRDGSPDLRHVEAAGESAARVLRLGSLVVLESTTYPGTTEELLRPILEEGSGFRAGEDFALAHSPERINPGDHEWGLHNTPKVVGGSTPSCTQLAQAFYEQFCNTVVPVSSPRAAEMSKLLENIFRHVNIALANEMAMICHYLDIDPWEVIDAAASKPFGFTPFKPGPGVGGHCLLPGERVTVRRDDRVSVARIEDVWQSSGPSETIDQVELAFPDRLQVAALDRGKASWDRVTAIGRRAYTGDAVRITARGGRSMAVTADHRMLVHDGRGLLLQRAADVRNGDLLPVWRGHELWDAVLNPRVDLLRDTQLPDDRIGVRLVEGDWRPWRSAIRRRLGQRRTDDVMRRGRLPLAVFRALEDVAEIAIPHDELVLWTGRGRSARSFPAVVEITPDIARMVGYYVAEGCTTGRPPRVVFAFHRDEAETKDDLRKLLGSLGLTWSEWEDPNCLTTQIKVSNLMFVVLLRDALGCGSDSYDARLPEVLLGASSDHRRELLSGLIRGDGSVSVSSKPYTYERKGNTYTHRQHHIEVGYFSVHERLAEDVDQLFRSFGYVPSVRRRPTQPGLHLRIHGSQDIAWLSGLFCDVKRDRIDVYLAGRKRTGSRSRAYERRGDLHLVPVESIERFDHDGPVYSLNVEPSHVFAASHGIVIGNCIPLDPQYLAWRVRGRLGHQFRILETADDVNQRMPAHIAQRAGEILNEEGKAVRGAKILLLGVAYKAGSSDLRESPALKIIDRLERSGADITYHDPHVPRFTVEDRVYESTDLRALEDSDLVLVLTDHPDVDYADVTRRASLVFDTRGVTWGMPDTTARVYRA